MPSRLVALDEGSDITLDRTMVVVGRHPACDTRLDSLRVSRHHCCMTQENGEVVVRDLGSTNGIRINGQRVEIGRLRPGDELSIAHIRYRLENGQAHEQTLAEPAGVMAMAARQDERVAAMAMPNKPAACAPAFGGRRERPGGRGSEAPPGRRRGQVPNPGNRTNVREWPICRGSSRGPWGRSSSSSLA